MHQISTLLAKRLLLTDVNDLEPEEYILTPEEEESAISNAIAAAKRHKEWKFSDKAGLGLSKQEVEKRLSEIDWSKEINSADVLAIANSNKNYAIWQENRRKAEAEAEAAKIEALKETWTARRFLGLMRFTSKHEFGKDLIENEYTLPLIKAVCFFLSNDERFETELGFSLKKGLLIRGICGIGKTHTIRCVAANELHPIFMASMLEICDEVRIRGDYELPFFNKLYLDDVGSEEPNVKHFGTNINWFKDFLETYYLRSQHYNKLIISTNNNHAELEQKYGFRVRSRIRDMFNVISVDGKDMRGL